MRREEIHGLETCLLGENGPAKKAEKHMLPTMNRSNKPSSRGGNAWRISMR